MRSLSLVLAALAVCAVAPAAEEAGDYVVHSFDRVQLSDKFYSEGASYGDLNRDGQMDVVAGPFWYAGPDFQKRHEFYPPQEFNINGYSKNFVMYVHDVNGDEWPDVLVIGFPGQHTWWYENPQGKEGHWPEHVAHAEVDNESPWFTDLTGDGQPELVFHTKGQFGWAGPDASNPTQPWKFHPVSPVGDRQRFTHGLGVGDVNGDGRMDILEKNGWWEQTPADSDQEFWTFHPHRFGGQGGAQMYAYDLDGDGDNDVITSLNAHAYGLAWFEHIPENGKITFREHLIIGEKPEQNKYGVAFSQLHAVVVTDMDGDGVDDIITGKRFWAHNGNDPGERDPVVSYWFKTVRTPDGVEFIPYQIDNKSGVGTQVTVGDVTGDGLKDVVVGNKMGQFVLVHIADKVSKEKWEAAQPKPLAPKQREASEKQSGILPKGPEGKELNVGFETGTLQDWVAAGDAFKGQPIKGDAVQRRRGDMQSGHAGDYWIGGYEVARDEPQGTLTSVAFKATHPWGSFLVGGGPHETTCVQIVRKDTGKVIFQVSGEERENMRRVAVDLQPHAGQEIFIRVVDGHSGHWGHVNFDDFRFHSEKPAVQERKAELLQPAFTHSGLSPEDAVKAMTLPEGFHATVFAAEPDVRQPIAFAFDDRGRLWVAEAYTYPARLPEGQGQDRVLIFEDKNGDGTFDERKVFIEGLNLVSGLEVGFGGAWVGQAPHLLFIPDKNGDDVPDADPEIVLDGWGFQDTHETLNSFIWGPDGWLYGCHGVFTHSRVGAPGTPDDRRVPINAGIWRFHPTKRVFEVFAWGTSNPWGVDFNDQGQSFLTCCVIPHLFHVIQGARYQRQAGQHFDPYVYADIQTIAKHRHWTGNQWNAGDRAKSDNLGGGHAHAGAMIYLADEWPKEYRNQLFMNNIHGARLNRDALATRGSGYVGDFAPDFLLTNDEWSQIINIRSGPDGQAYVIDWYDRQQCHRNERDAHDRGNGRIFKISHRGAKPVQVDLRKLSGDELVELQLHRNDWFVRHARRILQERGGNGKVHARLAELAFNHQDETRRLRGLWALHVTGGLTEERIRQGLANDSQYVRAWTIQLALEDRQPSPETLTRLVEMAAKDPSQVVRLYLASALQRLPLDARWDILAGLVLHAEDSDDHNLPLMYWYGLEPLAPADMRRALALAQSAQIPLVKSFTLRRIADIGSEGAIALLIEALGQANGAGAQLTYLNAVNDALKGRRSFSMPKPWPAVAAKLAKTGDAAVRDRTRALAVTFGDPQALKKTREIVADGRADLKQRKAGLESLLGAKDPQLPATLHLLLEDDGLRREALRGLAAYADPQTPRLILERWPKLSLDEKRDALGTLASRKSYALALLNAIETKRIGPAELSADVLRQLGNLRDGDINAKIGEVWGVVRDTPEEKQKEIGRFRKLIAGNGPTPDVHLGRAVFARTCQQCHKLFENGGTVGPELTGSNRANLDYLLSNVIDPSAVMAKEYQPAVVVTIDGRTVTGIVKKEDRDALTLVTANETVIVPRNEVEELKLSDKSMMPDNIWQQLTPHEVRSLTAYLAGPGQVAMLATPENAASLFNGVDLTGWTGDTGLWRVENGEIVGSSPGIRKNEFLRSDLLVGDFDLKVMVKLVPNTENSGIQFRSEVLPGGDVRGYQADIGAGWWGKLYEEHGRGLLWDKSAEAHLRPGEWNEYRIVAVGDRLRTWLNGHLSVDLHDPPGAKQGIIALQIHSGGPMEVRFKDFELSLDPSLELTASREVQPSGAPEKRADRPKGR